jgi:cyclopropane-fatty-acyl-phospholipid synthase
LLPSSSFVSSASRHTATSTTYLVKTAAGAEFVMGRGMPAFLVRVPHEAYWRRLWRLDPYRAGLAFIRGEFDIEGDLVAAIALWLERARTLGLAYVWHSLLPRLRVEHWLQSRRQARRNIAFHYDRSDAFYRCFLDQRLLYSCAYFADVHQSLDDAQLAKLNHVCRKLDLHAGETFLDIGCGRGALVVHAASLYGARALGCTLSQCQHDAAEAAIAEHRLEGRARVALSDYRDVSGRFDKVASVGMVEHVGRRRLGGYFKTLAALTTPSGLVLNHGIMRPSTSRADASTHFLQQRVFPGAELPSLKDTIVAAERAGLEVLDVENLRPHYALTCRAWVDRLRSNRDECLATVDIDTYRTWLLYLAASSAMFEHGVCDVYQVLLAKRSPQQRRHLTRTYMYGESGGSDASR